MKLGRRSAEPGPGARLESRAAALAEAVALAEGRLDPARVANAQAVLTRNAARLRHGTGFTVAALAGATGSGKSSLFNAIVGAPIAKVAVTRPTTSVTQACVWGEPGEGSQALLDWLEIPNRHHVPAPAGLEGLVLADLPDHDSVEVSHRLEVDRLVEVVDLLIWVVDPQKYADAALHDNYLRPLARHAGVMLVVLNQVDRLAPADRAACLADLHRRLDEDGLSQVPVLAASAVDGTGVDHLRAELAERVASRKAAMARIEADVAAAADALAPQVTGQAGKVDGAVGQELSAALADVAGVPIVVDAARRAFARDTQARWGWPFTRWLRGLRPDPLKRLHLNRGDGGRELPTLPPAGPIQEARLDRALRAAAEAAAGTLPEPWPTNARAIAKGGPTLTAQAQAAVGETDLGLDDGPGWWGVGAVVQMLLAAAAVVGGAWLLALFVAQLLQLSAPDTPRLGPLPYPTMLAVGGALAGLLVAAIGRRLGKIGGRRRASRIERRLDTNLAKVARERVLTPLETEMTVAAALAAALAKAR